MSAYEVDIRVDGETLVAQWDNRKLRPDRFTVIFLTAFWLVWTPVTLIMTYNLISVLDEERTPRYWFGVAAISVWLVFGYMGVGFSYRRPIAAGLIRAVSSRCLLA